MPNVACDLQFQSSSVRTVRNTCVYLCSVHKFKKKMEKEKTEQKFNVTIQTSLLFAIASATTTELQCILLTYLVACFNQITTVLWQRYYFCSFIVSIASRLAFCFQQIVHLRVGCNANSSINQIKRSLLHRATHHLWYLLLIYSI